VAKKKKKTGLVMADQDGGQFFSPRKTAKKKEGTYFRTSLVPVKVKGNGACFFYSIVRLLATQDPHLRQNLTRITPEELNRKALDLRLKACEYLASEAGKEILDLAFVAGTAIDDMPRELKVALQQRSPEFTKVDESNFQVCKEMYLQMAKNSTFYADFPLMAATGILIERNIIVLQVKEFSSRDGQPTPPSLSIMKAACGLPGATESNYALNENLRFHPTNDVVLMQHIPSEESLDRGGKTPVANDTDEASRMRVKGTYALLDDDVDIDGEPTNSPKSITITKTISNSPRRQENPSSKGAHFVPLVEDEVRRVMWDWEVDDKMLPFLQAPPRQTRSKSENKVATPTANTQSKNKTQTTSSSQQPGKQAMQTTSPTSAQKATSPPQQPHANPPLTGKGQQGHIQRSTPQLSTPATAPQKRVRSPSESSPRSYSEAVGASPTALSTPTIRTAKASRDPDGGRNETQRGQKTPTAQAHHANNAIARTPTTPTLPQSSKVDSKQGAGATGARPKRKVDDRSPESDAGTPLRRPLDSALPNTPSSPIAHLNGKTAVANSNTPAKEQQPSTQQLILSGGSSSDGSKSSDVAGMEVSPATQSPHPPKTQESDASSTTQEQDLATSDTASAGEGNKVKVHFDYRRRVDNKKATALATEATSTPPPLPPAQSASATTQRKCRNGVEQCNCDQAMSTGPQALKEYQPRDVKCCYIPGCAFTSGERNEMFNHLRTMHSKYPLWQLRQCFYTFAGVDGQPANRHGRKPMLCEHCHLPFLNVAHACSGRQGGRANPGANTACSTASSDSAGGQSRAHRQAPKSHNGTGRKQEAPHSSASGSSSTSSVQKPPISPNDQKSKTNKKKHNTSPPTPISDDIPAEEQWEDVHAEEDVVWVKNTAAMKLPSEVLDLCRSIPVEVAETCPQEMCLPPRTSKFQERMARITAAVIEDGVLRGRKLKEEEQQQQHSSMDRDGTLLLVLLPRIFLAKSPWSGDLERSKQLDAQHKRKELVNAQAKLERFLLDRVRTEEECWNTIKAALGEMKNWRNIEYKEGDTQSHHGKSLDAPQDSAIDMSQEDMLTEKMTQNGARAARLARQAEYSRAANLLDPNALQILQLPQVVRSD